MDLISLQKQVQMCSSRPGKKQCFGVYELGNQRGLFWEMQFQFLFLMILFQMLRNLVLEFPKVSQESQKSQTVEEINFTGESAELLEAGLYLDPFA